METLYEVLRRIEKLPGKEVKIVAVKEVVKRWSGAGLVNRVVSGETRFKRALYPLILANQQEVCFKDSRNYNPVAFQEIECHAREQFQPLFNIDELRKIKKARAMVKSLLLSVIMAIVITVAINHSPNMVINAICFFGLSIIAYALVYIFLGVRQSFLEDSAIRKAEFMDYMFSMAFREEWEKKKEKSEERSEENHETDLA